MFTSRHTHCVADPGLPVEGSVFEEFSVETITHLLSVFLSRLGIHGIAAPRNGRVDY